MSKTEKKVIDRFDGTEYGYMSNFSPHPVNFGGEVYPTSEHAYQAMKTLDPKEQKKIQKAKTPYIAKRLGRSCTLRKDWESVKRDLMFDIVLLKFYQHPAIAMNLVVTYDAELVEGNTWHDNFFGTCICPRCGNKGKNQLGKILMEVREILLDSYKFNHIFCKGHSWYFADESEFEHGPYSSKLEACMMMRKYFKEVLGGG